LSVWYKFLLNPQLILRKNIHGVYVIEIETPADRFTIKASDVTDLMPNKFGSPEDFSLVYHVQYVYDLERNR
jgi:hypothetical protein